MIGRRAVCRVLALAAWLLAPVPALALGYACTFTRYCVEERSCQPSGLTLHIRPRADATAPDQWEMETGGAATARVIPLRQIRDPLGDSQSFVSPMEFDTIHLVSIFKHGITRYAMHNSVEGIQSQSFRGACEVAP